MRSKVINIPRRLTDRRRFSKNGKQMLAAWVAIKMAHTNSTLYGADMDTLASFLHVRPKTAKSLLAKMWEESELFYVNKKKNCIFAKSCKDRTVKYTRKGWAYISDDVIQIPIPECYFKNAEAKLEDLVRLIETALVLKEYVGSREYQYKKHGSKEFEPSDATPELKTQGYVARRTGLSRYKVGRILRGLVAEGMLIQEKSHIKRCRKGERYSFRAINKNTRMPYWAKMVPSVYTATENMQMRFRHIIYNCKKRVKTKFMSSTKSLSNLVSAVNPMGFELQTMAARQIQMREAWD